MAVNEQIWGSSDTWVNAQCTGTVLRAETPKTRILRVNKIPLSPNVNTYSWLFPQTPWTAQNGWNYLITTAGGVDNGS